MSRCRYLGVGVFIDNFSKFVGLDVAMAMVGVSL